MIWPSHNVLSAMAENAKPDLTRTEVGATKGAEGKRLDMCLLKLRRLGLVALEGGRYTLTPAGRAFLESGKRLTSGPRGPQPGQRLGPSQQRFMKNGQKMWFRHGTGHANRLVRLLHADERADG